MDHHALAYLKQSKLGSGRLTRWTLALQEYKLEIRHVSGKDNIGLMYNRATQRRGNIEEQ